MIRGVYMAETDMQQEGRQTAETEDKKLATEINRLVLLLNRVRLAEYVELMQKPWSMLWRSFTAGIFRGMGFALGFFLLSALALYILNLLVDLGIPILGDFIAQLLTYIRDVQRGRGL